MRVVDHWLPAIDRLTHWQHLFQLVWYATVDLGSRQLIIARVQMLFIAGRAFNWVASKGSEALTADGVETVAEVVGLSVHGVEDLAAHGAEHCDAGQLLFLQGAPHVRDF